MELVPVFSFVIAMVTWLMVSCADTYGDDDTFTSSVRSTHQAGKIRIIARATYEGIHAPAADTLDISSVPYEGKMCYELNSTSKVANRPAGWRNAGGRHIPRTQESLTEEQRRKMLEEVEKQQQDFGIQ